MKRSQEKCDILGNLPREICYKVLVYLTPEDIYNLFKCCKKWRRSMDYSFLWMSLYRRHYFYCEEEPNTGVDRKQLQSCFMYNRTLEFNIENNIFKSIPIQINHNHFYNFIHFDDRTLVLDFHGRLYIINSSTGLIRKTFPAPSYNAILKYGDLLVVITKPFRLAIFNIELSKLLVFENYSNELNNRHDLVYGLQACKHLIIITAQRFRSTVLYLFNMTTNKLSYLGNSMHAGCTNDMIAIAEINGTIQIFDFDFTVLMKFDCLQANEIYKIFMNNDFLVKEFQDLQLRCYSSIWNIKTKTNFVIPIKKNYCFYVVGIVSNYKLIGRSGSKSCEVWNLRTQNRIFKIDTGKCIRKIIYNNKYIFISSIENVTLVFSLRSGKFVQNWNDAHERSTFYATTNTKLLCFNERRLLHKHWEILDYEKNISDM